MQIVMLPKKMVSAWSTLTIAEQRPMLLQPPLALPLARVLPRGRLGRVEVETMLQKAMERAMEKTMGKALGKHWWAKALGKAPQALNLAAAMLNGSCARATGVVPVLFMIWMSSFVFVTQTGKAKLVAQPKSSEALPAFLDFIEDKTDVQITLVYEAGLPAPSNFQCNRSKKEVAPGLQGHTVVFRQVWVRYIGTDVAKRPDLKQSNTLKPASVKTVGLRLVSDRAMVQRSYQKQLAVPSQESWASRPTMERRCGFSAHLARLMGLDRDSLRSLQDVCSSWSAPGASEHSSRPPHS